MVAAFLWECDDVIQIWESGGLSQKIGKNERKGGVAMFEVEGSVCRCLIAGLFLIGAAAGALARQTVKDVVTESFSDFTGLRENRGYGSLAKDQRERTVVDQVVRLAMAERVGVWESSFIDRPLPVLLENAGTLYIELTTNVSARLFIKEKGSETRKEVLLKKGFFTDRSIYIGPDDDGLLFVYTIIGDRMYALLNPNGCQKRIYFKKTSAILPEVASTIQGDVIRSTREGIDRGDYNRQNGWYESTRLPPDRYGGRFHFEKMFLILNATMSEDGNRVNRAFPVYYNKGIFYLDCERWRYPDYMDNRQGPFGFFCVSGSGISFDMPPFSKGELNDIRLKGALALNADGKKIQTLAMDVINSDKTFVSTLTRWIEDGPEGRKLFFRKIESRRISADDIRFISPFSSEGTVMKEQAETYARMINQCVEGEGR